MRHLHQLVSVVEEYFFGSEAGIGSKMAETSLTSSVVDHFKFAAVYGELSVGLESVREFTEKCS